MARGAGGPQNPLFLSLLACGRATSEGSHSGSQAPLAWTEGATSVEELPAGSVRSMVIGDMSAGTALELREGAVLPEGGRPGAQPPTWSPTPCASATWAADTDVLDYCT